MGESEPSHGPDRSVDDVLAHFGVKGMKWGVRSASPGGSMPSADAKSAANIQSKIKRGNTKTLSNKELQALITRMNLEQQYSRLTKPSGKKTAGKFVADILLNVGKQEATKLIAQVAAKQLASALKR